MNGAPFNAAPFNGAPFDGALYIMAYYIRHFLTLHSVNKTLFDAIYCERPHAHTRSNRNSSGPAAHLDGAPVELGVVREPGELRGPAGVGVQGLRLQERLRGPSLRARRSAACDRYNGVLYNGAPFNGALYIMVYIGVLYYGAPFNGALHIMV